MLKEDKPLLDPAPPGDGGNQFQTQATPQRNMALASIASSVKMTESTDAAASMQTQAEPMADVMPAAQPQMDSTLPSVTGIDRSSWPSITVSPIIGNVKHGYTYHEDLPDRLYTHTAVDLNQGPEAAMEAALDDTQCNWASSREWTTALVKKPFWQAPNVAKEPTVTSDVSVESVDDAAPVESVDDTVQSEPATEAE
jgi:hypothetical protein